MFLWTQVTPFYQLEKLKFVLEKGLCGVSTCLMRISFAFNLLAWEAGTGR